MGSSDLRDALEFLRPRNFPEEFVAVLDVRLDLGALRVVQRAARNGKKADLLRRQQRFRLALEAGESGRRNFGQFFGSAVRQARGFVDAQDEFHESSQPREVFFPGPVDGGKNRLDTLPSVAQEIIELLSGAFELDPSSGCEEALLDELPLRRIKLFRLHQQVLAHSDLAEIVQQGGVLQLLQVPGGKADLGVGPNRRAVHDLGQAHSQRGDALRVAGSGGITQLDGLDRRPDEALELVLDVAIEPVVFERHRRLAGERFGELLAVLRKRNHFLLNPSVRNQPRLGALLGVEQLENADDLVLLILHGDDQHRLGLVVEFAVKIAVQGKGKVGDATVSVLDVSESFRRDGVTRHALLVDGQGMRPNKELASVTLHQLEDEMLGPVRLLFHEIKRSRVGAGDFAALGHDQLEQRVRVALG